ncbi:unnamed protein product, partial [Linum tenue]
FRRRIRVSYLSSSSHPLLSLPLHSRSCCPFLNHRRSQNPAGGHPSPTSPCCRDSSPSCICNFPPSRAPWQSLYFPALQDTEPLRIWEAMKMTKKKKTVAVESSSPVGVLEDYFRSEEEEEESTSSNSPTQIQKSSSSRWNGIAHLFRSNSKKPAADNNSNNNKPHPLSALKSSFRSFSMREHVSTSSVLVPNFFPDSASHWNDDGTQRMNFTLAQLQAATNNFSPGNMIGKGGYAEVYKGRLWNGKSVAIKRLTRGTPDEMTADFLSELGIMAHVKHPNTAKLIGYGVEGGMHLVLHLSSRGSLASSLYGSRECLSWEVRYKVAIGTAQGLVYLHRGCQRRIIHRDIKAANILLTEEFEPQRRYLAPEFLMHGIVDEKTDVFAFGVLLLELVTGRRALDYKEQSLVLWAKPLLKKNDIRELVDPALGNDYDAKQANLMLLAAALCIQQSAIRRPQMPQVEQVLRGKVSCLKCPKRCRVPFFTKAFREELLKAEELEFQRGN